MNSFNFKLCFLVLSIFILTGCKKNNNSNRIVGAWSLENDLYQAITFNSNGTFKTSSIYTGGTGTYTVVGDTLSLDNFVPTTWESWSVPSGSYEIIKLNKSVLKFDKYKFYRGN